MAASQGALLTQQIEALLHRKQVFFFVKYFDTEFRGNAMRKYPISKLYTQEEVIKARQIVAGAFTEAGAVSQLAGSSVGAASGDKQLFSPTTKEILQEIEAESTHEAVLGVQLPAAKRTLLFGDNSAQEISDNLDSARMPPNQEDGAAVPIGESPVKKSKNKGKDKDA